VTWPGHEHVDPTPSNLRVKKGGNILPLSMDLYLFHRTEEVMEGFLLVQKWEGRTVGNGALYTLEGRDYTVSC
jgi:hypothetical protein